MPEQKKRSIAVALQYNAETGETPTVSASGYGCVADKILDMAFALGIKVREDADLAEVLMAIDLDTEIPPEAFTAVAEILSYIYELNVAQEKGFLAQ